MKYDFVRGHCLGLPDADEHVVIHIEITKFARDLGIFRHGIAGDADLAFVVARGIDHLLHTRNQRGESRHHYPPLGAAEYSVQRPVNHCFGLRPAGAVRVGAVRHQKQDAPLRETGQLGVIRLAPVNRRVVKFVIAGMHNHAVWRLDPVADAIRECYGRRESSPAKTDLS